MEEALIHKLIEFVEAASPVVWEAAYRQAYVEAIGSFLIFVFLIALATLSFRWCRSFRSKSIDLSERIANTNGYHSLDAQKESANTAAILCAVATILAVYIAISVLGDVIGRVINPDYYAIKVLAGMVGL